MSARPSRSALSLSFAFAVALTLALGGAACSDAGDGSPRPDGGRALPDGGLALDGGVTDQGAQADQGAPVDQGAQADQGAQQDQGGPSDQGVVTPPDFDAGITLDDDCMNGANAATDPYRALACATFAHINNDRAHFSAEAGGAGPLVWNEDIWEVAVAHSRAMCERGMFQHEIDGDGPSERAAAAGLGFTLAENISANLDPAAAQYGWMEEPTCTGHRGNNLNPKAIEAAVGYHICNRPTDEYTWGQHHHITTNFRRNGSIPASPYCTNPATACEIPPNPPTTAVCPAMLVQWGFCPVPSAATLSGWGCPND